MSKMKARFNYDLTEVNEILQLTRALKSLEAAEPSEGSSRPMQTDRRYEERRELIERAEYLTKLMENEREKARAAQSNLEIVRALNLLKAS